MNKNDATQSMHLIFMHRKRKITWNALNEIHRMFDLLAIYSACHTTHYSVRSLLLAIAASYKMKH